MRYNNSRDAVQPAARMIQGITLNAQGFSLPRNPLYRSCSPHGLGHGNWSNAAADRLLDLLETRTARMRPTIITSPWTPEQWKTMPAGDASPEILEAIAGRLEDWFTHASLA